jgi:DNA (cytosine-5)-methyltransferase 1
MRYFSLFTGAGGFEIGLERAHADHRPELTDTEPGQAEPQILERRQRTALEGGRRDLLPRRGRTGSVPRLSECVGFSEIDRHASAVLRHRFPEVRNHGDITKIDWASVPDFDLLVGGSPCQDLSIAGRRAGLAGARSGLFREYVRALREKKPAYFIWENVKGALSSSCGTDFAAVLDSLAQAGYALWWQVLNARDFGVPQNRERVFVVGARDGRPREIFLEPRDRGEARREDAHTLKARHDGGVDRKHPKTLICDSGGGVRTIDANYGKGPDSYGARTMILHQNQSGFVSPHDISAAQGANRSRNYQTVWRDARIRRLTPRECERLMSWPDDWTRHGDYGDGPREISDTQRYRMCGNGVVSAVVSALVEAHGLLT